MNRSVLIREYIQSTFVQESDAHKKILSASHKEGLPQIQVPSSVGKLLYLITKLQNPKRILEIGTLAGYSTEWIRQAAPEAAIITIEPNPLHAKLARAHHPTLTVIEEDALITLKRFSEKQETFDLIFLDANKQAYSQYLPLLLTISKPGTLILSDNLIPREEEINNPDPKDPFATSVYAFNQSLASDPRLETILIPTIIGSNGRLDALGLSIVK